jgi:SAM-dependent methyltransferase
MTEGWHGWDDYAAFYDWENARTLGRRDVPFWRERVAEEGGPVLELGCGTGRLLAPIARTGVPATGIDRSGPMLERAVARVRRLPRAQRPAILRGDIRRLPFKASSFGTVLAAYGLLQSLLRESDLKATLADAARVLRRGGLFGVDLVPDLPKWTEYERRVSLKGRASGGRKVTLIESVRQDRRRHLTIFDEEFIERVGRRETRRQFSLSFRTVTLRAMEKRLAAAGFRITALCGDYRGGPLEATSDAWVILARKL